MSMHQSTETQGWFSPSYSLHPHERFGVQQALCIRSIRTDNRGSLDSLASQVLARPFSGMTSELILYQSVKGRLVKYSSCFSNKKKVMALSEASSSVHSLVRLIDLPATSHKPSSFSFSKLSFGKTFFVKNC